MSTPTIPTAGHDHLAETQPLDLAELFASESRR
jgi:hypothetical protein